MQHNFSSAPVRPQRVPLNFANGDGLLYAGSYRDQPSMKLVTYQTRLLRVNMAAEIDRPADIVVPVADFGVPPTDKFMEALYQSSLYLVRGDAVFVGCGYGIGRTGTFLAALCALNREVLWITRRASRLGDDAYMDPVAEIRKLYHPAAVETDEQAAFVRSLHYRDTARRIALRTKPLVLLDKRYWVA